MLDTIEILALVIAGQITGWLGGSLVSYTKEKGKNLAAKEDLARLTAIAEEIKSQFSKSAAEAAHGRAEILEKLKSQESLRQLAGERRLAALQEAYALWRQLSASDMGDDGAYVRACHWWQRNSLYLDPVPREAFASAVSAWLERRHYQGDHGGRGVDIDGLKRVGDRLTQAGDAIVGAAGLPSLASGEAPPDIPKFGIFVWQTNWGVPYVGEEDDQATRPGRPEKYQPLSQRNDR